MVKGSAAGIEFAVKAEGVTQASQSIKGLSAKFVGLSFAVNTATRAFQEGIKWVGKSIQQYRDYEKQITEVSTLIGGAATDSIKTMGLEIEHLSIKWGQAVGDLTTGLYDIVSAAVDVEDAMGLLNVATRAAIAGLADVSVSVDVFTSILKAWGMEASQMDRIADELFQTIRRGKLRFDDLAHAMGYIAPIAAGLGVEFREIAAAFQTTTRQGQHLDMVTRGLALGLQNIANATPAAAEAALHYGVDLSHTALSVFGLESVLRDMNEAMEEHGYHILPEMIRNMRSYRVFMALTGSSLEEFVDDLRFLEESAGAADEALNKMMTTAQMQSDLAQQHMEKLERSVGEAWHSIDIAWQKTKLWFGTLISERSWSAAWGALDKLDTQLLDVRQHYVDMMITERQYASKKPLMTMITEYRDELQTTSDMIAFLEEQVDMSEIQEFFDITDRKIEIESALGDLGIVQEQMSIVGSKFKDMNTEASAFGGTLKAIGGGALTLAGAITTAFVPPAGAAMIGFGAGMTYAGIQEMFDSFELDETANVDAINKINEALRAINETTEDEELQLIKYGSTWRDIIKYFDENEKEINDLRKEYEELINSQEELEKNTNILKEGIADYARFFDNARQQIGQLTHEIMKIEEQVERTYRTFTGDEFAGRLRWEMEILGLTTAHDRLQRFMNLSMQFGDEMRWDFMEGMPTPENGDSWNVYDLDAWNTTLLNVGENIGDFDTSFTGFVEGFIEATSSLRTTNEALEDYNETLRLSSLDMDRLNLQRMRIQMDSLSESIEKNTRAFEKRNLAIARNSLEIAKLQLLDKQRRHGLRRGDQRKLDDLQIKNMELRIEKQEEELRIDEKYFNQNINNKQNMMALDKKILGMRIDNLRTRITAEEEGGVLWNVREAQKKYNDMAEIFSQYETRAQTNLDNMEDIRNQEMEDMVLRYDQQSELLDKYRDKYDEIITDIEDRMDDFTLFMQTLSTQWPNIWESLLGKDIWNKFVGNMHDLGKLTGYEGFMGLERWEDTPKVDWSNFDYSKVDWSHYIGLRPEDVQFRHPWKQRKRGTHYVPSDMLAVLHRGEKVVPAGSRQHGDSGETKIHIDPITVNADIRNYTDIHNLAGKIGEIIAAELVEGVESRYTVG